MSCKVIELNDRAIKVGGRQGVVLCSPGFALADGQQLLLGERAEQQARLQPAQSYNRYWQELNLDGMPHGNGFRHHADLAFAHLQHLAREADLTGEVIVAVPGSFTRQQLAILLGLTQHSPFKVSGVVDSALAAAVAAARASNILYADLQLHQLVVTRLRISGNELHCGATVQIPGVGSQDFIALMMQLATGMFIQQCRFNPQHDARSEQQLYNELPGWLQQARQDGNLVLELHAGDVLHTAKMPMAGLISACDSHFTRINQQLAAMTTADDTQLMLSPALVELPGFIASLPASVNWLAVDQRAVNDACLTYRQRISGSGAGLSLVTSLPLPRSTVAALAGATKTTAAKPTHVLHDNRAWPARQLGIHSHRPGRHADEVPAGLVLSIVTTTDLPDPLGVIAERGDGVYFDSGKLPYLLNGSRTSGERRLAIGDRLQFAGSNEILTLIQVHND